MNSSNPSETPTPPVHFQARNYEVPVPHHFLSPVEEAPAHPIVPCLCCVRRTTGHYTRIKLILRFHPAE